MKGAAPRKRGAAVAWALAATLLCAPAPALAASSADTSAAPSLAKAASELEKRSQEAAKARSKAEEARSAHAEAQAEADAARAEADRARSDLEEAKGAGAEAVRTSYKMRCNAPGLLGLLLDAEDFNSMVLVTAALNAVERSSAEAIEGLAGSVSELEAALAQAERLEAEAAEAKEGAESALAEAERLEAEAAAERQRAYDKAQAEQRQAAPQASSGSSAQPTASVPGVDWTVGREAFVAEWSARIDRYLAGFPLAGHGRTFAEAAWDNGVDPRWSPAISNTESTRGKFCFRPHNAWGWGSVSWPDWDTAIRAHVAGLARGYGSTITPAAAKKYCPPTWQHWYQVTSAEMARI